MPQQGSPKRVEPPAPSRVVAQVAKNLGVDLAKVSGTGPGGAITCKDVYGSVKKPAPVRPPASPVPTPRPPAQSISATHARNALLDQVRAEPGGPRRVAAAEGQSPAPTLFASGDLPPFTASGVDPSELLKVPWFARHHLASITDTAKVEQLLTDYAGPDGDLAAQTDGVSAHRGNHDYAGRLREWLDRGDVAASRANADRVWRQAKTAPQQAQAAREKAFAEGNFDSLFTRQVPDDKGSR